MNFIYGILIATVLLGAPMIVKGVTLQPDISDNYEKVEQLEFEISCEKQRVEEIDLMTEKADTDEYIEKIAREKLGMVRADEIVFIDISGQ